jgi:hypothetical protein
VGVGGGGNQLAMSLHALLHTFDQKRDDDIYITY